MGEKFCAAMNGFTLCDNRECISPDVYPLLEFCADLCYLCVPWPDDDDDDDDGDDDDDDLYYLCAPWPDDDDDDDDDA